MIRAISAKPRVARKLHYEGVQGEVNRANFPTSRSRNTRKMPATTHFATAPAHAKFRPGGWGLGGLIRDGWNSSFLRRNITKKVSDVE